MQEWKNHCNRYNSVVTISYSISVVSICLFVTLSPGIIVKDLGVVVRNKVVVILGGV
jgi:hypothetical protein